MIVFVATCLISAHTAQISISINDVESNAYDDEEDMFEDELKDYSNIFINASKPYPPPNVSKIIE